ncbi:MAG: hypothetical protein ACLU0O_09445 [Collinsella sp.]
MHFRVKRRSIRRALHGLRGERHQRPSPPVPPSATQLPASPFPSCNYLHRVVGGKRGRISCCRAASPTTSRSWRRSAVLPRRTHGFAQPPSRVWWGGLMAADAAAKPGFEPRRSRGSIFPRQPCAADERAVALNRAFTKDRGALRGYTDKIDPAKKTVASRCLMLHRLFPLANAYFSRLGYTVLPARHHRAGPPGTGERAR